MFHLSGDLLPLDSQSYKVDGLSCDLGFLCIILSLCIMVVLFFGRCLRWEYPSLRLWHGRGAQCGDEAF